MVYNIGVYIGVGSTLESDLILKLLETRGLVIPHELILGTVHQRADQRDAGIERAPGHQAVDHIVAAGPRCLGASDLVAPTRSSL